MDHALDTAVLIPSYKPDDKLVAYVKSLREASLGKIVIVDDGSGADYRAVFDAIPQDDTVTVLHYEPNQGKGVALKKGLVYLQEACADISFIVTADSDGQHTATDVLRMSQALHENGTGLLLGSRDFSQANVPFKSRNGNRITSSVFWLLYGHWVSDTQTGLRGFSRELLSLMAKVRGERYEYEMNVLIECAGAHIPMRALPIETVYENDNEGSHFRAFHDSARIYKVIFAGFFRFLSSSAISFLVDYGFYVLLTFLFSIFAPMLSNNLILGTFHVNPQVVLATVVARLISGLFNFFVNKRFVFDSHAAARKVLPRYLCVFVLIMLLSAFLTSTLHLWTGWSDRIAKIPVDLLLFFLSYRIQRNWVFAKGENEN